MIRTAFIFEDFDSLWMGGRNYYKCLFNAIESFPDINIDPLILEGIPSHHPNNYFGTISTIPLSILKPKTFPWVLRKYILKITNKDILLEKTLLKMGVKLISHQGYIGRPTPLNSIGWIPDFQHKNLQNNFSDKERQNRDVVFKKICETSNTIIVSSEAAKNDLIDFYPEGLKKGAVLNFIGNFPETLPTLFNVIQSKYHVQQPYFFIPNQFWKHKNHRLVVEALIHLKHQDVTPTVICSGSTHDINNPDYFSELKNFIIKNNLQKQFKIVGEIPYQDVISLYYYARAIINPSFFEGWSTVVEEARNLNKYQILSNIDVHIEQSPGKTIYVDPRKPEEMANAMFTMLGKKVVNDDLTWETLVERYALRKIAFAQEYDKIVAQTIQK